MKIQVIQQRLSLTTWALVLGFVATCIIMLAAWNSIIKNEQRIFSARANTVREEILQRLRITEEAISSLGTLVNSATHVDGDQFRIFSEEIMRNHPYITATSYFQYVADEDREGFEAGMRQRGFPTFSITQQEGSDYRPASSRAAYFSLLYQEPFEPARAVVIGFDALSNIDFAAAVAEAVDKAEASPAVPHDKNLLPSGYWLFKALYTGKSIPQGVEARRLNKNGLVAICIDPVRMLPLLGIDKSTVVMSVVSRNKVIAEITHPPVSKETASFNLSGSAAVKTLSEQYSLAIPGKTLDLQIERPILLSEIDFKMLATALFVSALMTLALVIAARNLSLRIREQQQRQEEIERQVTSKTAELAESNLKLKQEIDERQQAQKAMVESAARFRELFNNMSSGVAMYRAVGHDGDDFIFIDFNRAAERFEKISREEVIGRSLLELFPGVRECGLFDVMKRVWETGIAEHHPPSLYKDDRIMGWKEYYVCKLPSGEIVTVYDDVTEQRKVEEDLRQAQKLEAIGTLAGGIAHDFNNILAGIMGYTELALYKVPQGSPAHKHLKHVLDASVRAAELVKHILSFSRKSEQQHKIIRLQPILQDVIHLLRGTLPSTILIRKDIDDDCQPVLADVTDIQQIVMNLGTNAYHAMRENGGLLTIALKVVKTGDKDCVMPHDLAAGTYARLSVIDTGHGMDELTLSRIFEPYFTTKRGSDGTGLGLATVHSIVKNLHGSMTVDSQPGQGTTFTIFLPVVTEFLPAVTEEVSGIADTSVSIPSKLMARILLVDDEESIVNAWKEALENAGCEVTGVLSSREALELFQQDCRQFDVVITDQTMPNMTGDVLSRKLLSLRPDIRIIIASGYTELLDEEKAASIGISRFLSKPVALTALIEAVSTVLSNTQQP